jgi:hypothetical protein
MLQKSNINMQIAASLIMKNNWSFAAATNQDIGLKLEQKIRKQTTQNKRLPVS